MLVIESIRGGVGRWWVMIRVKIPELRSQRQRRPGEGGVGGTVRP